LAIEYNKKKERNLYGGGPRDLQRKQVAQQNQPVSSPEFYESIINDLKDQLKNVTDEVLKRGTVSADPSKKFTAEEFDEELIKQAGDIMATSEKRKKIIKDQEKELDSRKDIINSLEIKLEAKDEVIEALKARTIGEGEVFVEDSDRPEMETVFIDPTEQGKNKMESFIEVEEESITAKEEVDDKVNKLKNLIGSVKK
jgi:hypothetical protein